VSAVPSAASELQQDDEIENFRIETQADALSVANEAADTEASTEVKANIRVSAVSPGQNTQIPRPVWTPTLRLKDKADGVSSKPLTLESQNEFGIPILDDDQWGILAEGGPSPFCPDTSLTARSSSGNGENHASTGMHFCSEGADECYYLDDCFVIDPEAADSIKAEEDLDAVGAGIDDLTQDDIIIDSEAADPCHIETSRERLKVTDTETDGIGSALVSNADVKSKLALAAEDRPQISADPCRPVQETSEAASRVRNGAEVKPQCSHKELPQVPIDLNKPSLAAVLGSWWDEEGSHYEVTFDRDSSSSCCVKTTRPGGVVLTTAALIHFARRNSRFRMGSIVWGGAFALVTPLEHADELRWTSSFKGNGKEFVWTRHQASCSRQQSEQGFIRGKSGKGIWRPRAVESTKANDLDDNLVHTESMAKNATTDSCCVDRRQISLELFEHETDEVVADVSGGAKSESSLSEEEPPRESVDLTKPTLEVVLGFWWDTVGSYYEVAFNKGCSSSCSVKTFLPGGVVRSTKGLIRIARPRSRFPSGSIVWGEAFVLDTPIRSADELKWIKSRTGKPHRGKGKDFLWTRHEEEGNCSESEPEQGQECIRRDNVGKAVWRSRTARSKTSGQKSTKTKTSVACRRVQAHNGIWRVIRKEVDE
jgi:hypothetical protein